MIEPVSALSAEDVDTLAYYLARLPGVAKAGSGN